MTSWYDDALIGLHYDLHATPGDTELGAAATVEHLRQELARSGADWIQCDGKGIYGLASWPTKTGTPAPGIVADALRAHRDATRELGLPLVVHYCGLWDDAAVAEHPEWAKISVDGAPHEHGPCVRSDYRRERMIPQLLELIRDYDVDGFWIDAENWVVEPCWCDRCLSAFREATGLEAPRSSAEEGWRTWLELHRAGFVEHVRDYLTAVRAEAPHVHLSSNWLYSSMQPESVALPVDRLSGDLMPVWGMAHAPTECRALDTHGLPWDLMVWGFFTLEDKEHWTFKTAVQLCQESAVALACGGRVQVYETPRRDGQLLGWHQDVLGDVVRFAHARKDVVLGTTSVPQVAVLHSSSHIYGASDKLFGAWQPDTDQVRGAVLALLGVGVHVDVLTEQQLVERAGEFALVVVPEQERLPSAVVDALTSYVDGGGRLLLTGAATATQLSDLAGIRPAGDVTEQPYEIPVDTQTATVGGPWLPVDLAGAQELAPLVRYVRSLPPDPTTAAMTLHERGAGRVVTVPGGLFAHYFRTGFPRSRAVVQQALDALRPPLRLQREGAHHVHATLRRKGDAEIVHLVTTAGEALSKNSAMVEEVPLVDVTVRLRREAAPAAVRRVPDGDVTWRYEDGEVVAEVAAVGIHTALVLQD